MRNGAWLMSVAFIAVAAAQSTSTPASSNSTNTTATPTTPSNSTSPAATSTSNSTVASNSTNSTTRTSISTTPTAVIASATPQGLVNITAYAPGQTGTGQAVGPNDGYIASAATSLRTSALVIVLAVGLWSIQ